MVLNYKVVLLGRKYNPGLMDFSATAGTSFGPPSAQTHKLYIKVMEKGARLPLLEAQYLAYLRDFGPIDDLKILKNSGFTS